MIFGQLATPAPPSRPLGSSVPGPQASTAYSGAGPCRLIFSAQTGQPAAIDGPRRAPLRASLTNIPLPRGSVDEVVIDHALSMVPYKKVLHALQECRRVLRPGGRFVATGVDAGELLEAARRGSVDLEDMSLGLAGAGYLPDSARGWFTEGRAIDWLWQMGFAGVRGLPSCTQDDPTGVLPPTALPYTWTVEATKPRRVHRSITFSGWTHLSSMYYVGRELGRAFEERGYTLSYQKSGHDPLGTDMLDADEWLSKRVGRPHLGSAWLSLVGLMPPEPRDLVAAFLPADSTLMDANLIAELNRKCHMLLTCSTLSRDILYRSGAEIPIHVLPLGIDLDVFSPHGPTDPMGVDDDTFVFFCHCHFQPRKGLDILLTAFVEEFCHGENVALVVKESEAVRGTGQALARMIKLAKAGVPDPPEIRLIVDAPPAEGIAAMLRRADCFVWSTRIEGFGLPPLEALACGTPVVSPSFGGFMDYLDDEVAILTEVDGMERMDEAARRFRLFDPAGEWGRPDPQSLRRGMRRAFEDRQALQAMGEAGVRRASQYGWPEVAGQWVDLIDDALPW